MHSARSSTWRLGILTAPLFALILALAPLMQIDNPIVALITRLLIVGAMVLLLAEIILQARRVYIHGRYFFYIVLPFSLWITWGLIASLFSPYNIRLDYVVLIIGLFAFIMIVGSVRIDSRSIEIAVKAGLFSGLILALYALASQLASGRLVAEAWFSGSNQLGGMLLVQMFFPLYFWINKRSSRFMTLGITFFMSYAILMSGSRSALLSLIVLLVIVGITGMKDKRRRWLIYGLTICSLIAGLYVFFGNYDVIKAYLSQYNLHVPPLLKTMPLGGRLPIWSEFLAESLERPLTGFGFSLSLLSVDGRAVHPHNTFILALYQTGIIGMALIIWLMAGLMIYLSRYSYHPTGRLIFSLTVALILREFWEINLLANNSAIAVSFWTILLISISSIHNRHG